jgi:hypothetical protein
MNENPSGDQGEHGEHDDDSSKKAEVHAEEVKERHTSHWDVDYMSAEELEAAYREGQEKKRDQDDESTAG